MTSTTSMEKKLNRLKVVLAEKKRTNRWLAEQLGKDQTTISKWCTNTCQSDLASLMHIAQLIEVELTDLVRFEEFKQNERKYETVAHEQANYTFIDTSFDGLDEIVTLDNI